MSVGQKMGIADFILFHLLQVKKNLEERFLLLVAFGAAPRSAQDHCWFYTWESFMAGLEGPYGTLQFEPWSAT